MPRTPLPALVLTLLVLAGCATAPAPALRSLTASTPPSLATSLKTASVTYVSGDLEGSAPAPAVLSGKVLYSTPPDEIEPWLFNLQDQADVTEALQANLVRLQVFKSVEFSSAPKGVPDLKIIVVFTGTDYQPGQQQYTLNVTMQIQAGAMRLRKDYRVFSNPTGSRWTALRVSREQAKAAAAKALLEQLLPDIQAFALDKA